MPVAAKIIAGSNTFQLSNGDDISTISSESWFHSVIDSPPVQTEDIQAGIDSTDNIKTTNPVSASYSIVCQDVTCSSKY